jgi:pimeloyl-ACP methyl ester carboxylesterase
VEHALLSHEAVSDAVTLLREQQDQDPELISFVTVWTNDHPRELDKLESQLRERLRVKLPSYMVPTTIRVLERMPINANGKVDRQALAKIAQAASPSRPVSARVPPRNDVERALCEEFASVLGTDVGITDSFFDLGGHSLIAARLVSSINIRLGCKIYVYDLLQSPQPFALSEIIHTRSNKEVSSSIPTYLERYRQSSSRLTVVLVHGFWGQASIFSKLVTLLDDDFDILLIHDPFFGESTCPKTIKDWAEFYLNDVEKRIPPGQGLVLAGYSFGGLIAFEMAALWRSRHCYDPASLVLLDAGTYMQSCLTQHDRDGENEIRYALRLFGVGQKEMILDHFQKVAPLMCSSVQSIRYNGTCLYLATPEAAEAGAVEWWTPRCPRLQTHFLDCGHHDVLADAMVGRVSRLVNEHCHHILESLGSPTS